MKCEAANALFALGGILLVAAIVLDVISWRRREPSIPRRQFWTDRIHLFKPHLYTPEGNRARRLALAVALACAISVVASAAVLFLWPESPGAASQCWMRPR